MIEKLQSIHSLNLQKNVIFTHPGALFNYYLNGNKKDIE